MNKIEVDTTRMASEREYIQSDTGIVCKKELSTPRKACETEYDKSPSINIIRGGSMNRTSFSVSKASDQSEASFPIPSIYSSWLTDGSISDRNSSAQLTYQLLVGLDKSHFTDTQKLCILQRLLQWPLLLYKILLKNSPDHLVSSCVPKLALGSLKMLF